MQDNGWWSEVSTYWNHIVVRSSVTKSLPHHNFLYVQIKTQSLLTRDTDIHLEYMNHRCKHDICNAWTREGSESESGRWLSVWNGLVSFLSRNSNKGRGNFRGPCEKGERSLCLLCFSPIVCCPDTGRDAQGHLRGHCQKQQHPRAARN